jgi:hypothetical protein
MTNYGPFMLAMEIYMQWPKQSTSLPWKAFVLISGNLPWHVGPRIRASHI